MIRFLCPGCGATYTVDDSKGGKTGKCPKCQSQFTIPMPEEAAAPPPVPAPAPANSNEPVEIAPCPGCQARLSVAPSDLGIDVECPYCKTVYTAKKPGTGASAPLPPPAPPRTSQLERAGGRDRREEEDEERPSRRRRRDEDDELEERPSRRRRDDDEEERPSRRRRRDEDDEEEEERPRRRRRRAASGDDGSGQATTAMVLGIIGLFAWCCPILGFIIGGFAVSLGGKASAASGGEKGKAGIIMGWICIGLSLVNCIGGAIMRVTNPNMFR